MSRTDGSAGPTAPRHILVADDHQDSAVSLAMLLRRLGHEVHVVFDGHEAVTAAAATRPSVVLLDLSMPKLDGYEAARRIRELGLDPRPMIIALTGWGADARRGSDEPAFDAHLVKPVDPAALDKLLAGWTSGGNA